jgi:hypothetical protein
MLNDQPGDPPGIDPVCAELPAGAVVDEQAVPHRQCRRPVVTAQNAALIVLEPDALHCQGATICPDTGAVAIRHMSANEREVANGYPPANDDEQGLALAGDVADERAIHPGALDRQIVGLPDRALRIAARRDRNGVTRLGSTRGGGQRRV